MVTTNVNKADGLINGTRGYVTDIDREKKIIWVKFTDNGIGFQQTAKIRNKYRNLRAPLVAGSVPIVVESKSFQLKGHGCSVRRQQFPLVVSYAVTVHKSQGQTLDEVIINFEGKTTPECGSFFVAMSRVRRLENLFLTSFKRDMIKASSRVKTEMENMRRDKPYIFWNHPLSSNVLENLFENEKEIKITYLNINGLLEGDHLLDLDHDLNLKNSDLICISETKLGDADFDIENARIEDVIKQQKVMEANIADLIIGLEDATNVFGAEFESIFVDTSVMNGPATALCGIANRMIKEKWGIPAASAPSVLPW